MTAKCIKNEMRKALFSRAALITYLLSFSLVIYHTVTKAEIYNSFYTAYKTGAVQGNPMITAVSLFCNWLGADVTSFAASVFFFLLPIIAVMPYGWSLAGEIKSGYTKNIISRIPRKVYFFSKYLASFVSGALAVMIPLLLSFLLVSLFLPALHMENIYPYGAIGEKSMWAELYYSNPFLYSMMYILLDGVFAGLIACISTVLAFFTRSRVSVVLMPFFLMLFLDYIDINVLPGWELSPVKFLQALPVVNERNGVIDLVFFLIFSVFTLGILLYKERKYEAL